MEKILRYSVNLGQRDTVTSITGRAIGKMKRIAAFWIDQMLLVFLFQEAFFVMMGSSNEFPEDKMVWLLVISGLVFYFGYFFVCDYFFCGMTLGKKVLRTQMQWCQGSGSRKIRESVFHVLLKMASALFFPISLLICLSSKGKMPYDKELGIIYLPGSDTGRRRRPVWEVIVRIVAACLMLYATVAMILTLGLKNISKKPYYSYADVTIASVSTALGEQKLTGYSFSGSSSSAEANYQYRIDDGEDAAERYVQYLLHNEGASYVDGNPMILRKNGMDHKYDVTIKLVWNSKYLQVTLHYNKL